VATTQHSIKLVKQFTYRGDTAKKFSNRYYFDGASPGDSSAWHTLMDAIVLAEKAIHTSSVAIVQALGYAPGSEVAVAQQDYATNGTLNVGTGVPVPGDCAVVLRMATTKKSSKNHTVFVFSYYHRAHFNAASDPPDTLLPAQRTAVTNYAISWLNGITVAGRPYKRCTPDGHLVTGQVVDQFIGHRDFPR